jgi:hypothetical protein
MAFVTMRISDVTTRIAVIDQFATFIFDSDESLAFVASEIHTGAFALTADPSDMEAVGNCFICRAELLLASPEIIGAQAGAALFSAMMKMC